MEFHITATKVRFMKPTKKLENIIDGTGEAF